MMTLTVIVAILLLAAALVVLVVQQLIYICQPNEVLIFSGSSRKVGRRVLGYRLVHGGRGVRIPLLERVDRLDLSNMVIEIRVAGAYSRGGIPLNVEGVANVKVASEEPTLANAIERFLGKPQKEIVRVAKETLEGNLRGVLATLTPEEVNHDRVKFAQCLLHEADMDLKKLGLVLDTLKIQNVSDDKGYLNSLGRKQSAELLMRSRIAEAENKALAAERNARNREERELARLEAEFSVAQAEAERRILDAQTQKAARVAEERGVVSAEVARAEAELAVQRARIEQVKLQLLADVVKPAEARQGEMVAAARGAAARILEDGKATAQSLEALATTWRQSGEEARQIVLAQKLGKLMEAMMGTVSSARVEKVTFLDSRLGGQGGGELASQALVASEQLKHVLGVDVPAMLSRLATPPLPTPPAASDGHVAAGGRPSARPAQHSPRVD
jgi:flotillin